MGGVFLTIARNVVYQGHVLDILKDWPSEIINMAVTSPPYWIQRLYKGLTPQVWGGKKDCKHEWTPHIIKKQRGSLGVSGWDRPSRKVHAGNRENPSLFCSKCGAWRGNLGDEPLLSLYVQHLATVMDEVKRVLRKDGTLWLNLGDTYTGSGLGSSGKQSYLLDNMAFRNTSPIKELPRKCMADIPHRVVIELVRRGWIHRQTVIWEKPNVLPESCRDRPTISYEFLFMLTKNPTYYYEQQFEPVQNATLNRRNLPKVGGNKFTSLEAPYSVKYSGKPVKRRPFRNLRSVWRISTTQFPDAHFAVFPTKLIERPIMASCPTAVCQTCGKPREAKYKRVRLKNPRRYEGNGKSGGLRVDEWAVHFMGYTGCKCANYAKGLVLDPFMGCYDQETEVLTRSGWRQFSELKETNEICTLNPTTNHIEYRTPLRIIYSPYQGRMYHVKTKGVDLLVTPNHNMYVAPRKALQPKSEWSYHLLPAEQIFGKYVIYKKDGIWKGKYQESFQLPSIMQNTGRMRMKRIGRLLIPMNDWLRFFGFWLAEGYVVRNREHIIGLRNTNVSVMQEMMGILQSWGLNPNHRIDHYRIRLNNQQLWTYLLQFGRSPERFVPQYIKELTSEQISLFLRYFAKGDGSFNSDGKISNLWTSSKKLSDDFMELGLKTGLSLTRHSRRPRETIFPDGHICRSKFPQYNLVFRYTQNRPRVDESSKRGGNQPSTYEKWVDYDGLVWCVEVPNHILYVRRNGIPVWCGNSGTTALVARALGRDWVGIELSDDYVEMTYKRLLRKKEK